MTDRAVTKADLLQAVERFADMATESEMRVMGELIGLQVLKAAFIRRARVMGLNAEQIDACHREILDQEQMVMALVKLLNETDAEALKLTMTQH